MMSVERGVFETPKAQSELSESRKLYPQNEREGIRVVFLDIEGVLRPDRSIEMFVEAFKDVYVAGKAVDHYNRYAPWSVDILNEILAIQDVYIVISSSLRYNMKKIIDNFILNGIDPKKIIGRTPDFDKPESKDRRGRGNEIKEFLKLYGGMISDYLVIDDDDFDLDPIPDDNLIKVDTKYGLLRKHLMQIKKRW